MNVLLENPMTLSSIFFQVINFLFFNESEMYPTLDEVSMNLVPGWSPVVDAGMQDALKTLGNSNFNS